MLLCPLLPAPATGRAQTCSRAVGQARVPASGCSDGGQAEARSAGTRARRDRRHRRPTWAQGSRGRKVPQTPPSSSPAPAGRRAGRAQGPGRVRPASPGCLTSCRSRGPACLAQLAWHHFLDILTPREAAPPPFQGPGPLPRPRWRAQPLLTCADPRGRTRSPLREEQGWGIYFFSPFLFFNKKN